MTQLHYNAIRNEVGVLTNDMRSKYENDHHKNVIKSAIN